MYRRKIEKELIQHFVSGNLSLKVTRYEEIEAKLLKAKYYRLELKEDNNVVFAPIAESNLERIWSKYDIIYNAMNEIKCGN